MKLQGQKIQGPNYEIVVIPHQGRDLVFKAEAVLDYKRFEALVRRPTPPKVRKKGNQIEENYEDKYFIGELKQYGDKKWNYTIIESLKATKDLEWEKVKYDEPSTWHLWEEELAESGFSDKQMQLILTAVLTANCLNEEKIEAARQRFLASQEAEQDNSLSQMGEVKSTPSGELVNASN